jgi:hypothetical protein
VICAVVCVGAGATHASGSGSGRVYEMRFSAYCRGARKIARVAPHVLGALAQVTVPLAWHTIRVPPNTSPSGGGCAQPYLLTDRRGDAGLCVQEAVYATVSTSPFGAGDPIARGKLPTVAGMHGVWEELNTGVTDKYPEYQVVGLYEAANRKLFYELMVVPPPTYPNGCHGSGPTARAVARQLATSFRVEVTDPATAQTFRSWARARRLA